MNTITDFISKYLPRHISIPLVLHILILSGIKVMWAKEEFVNFLRKSSESLPLLAIAITLSSFYLVLLASYIFLCFKIRNNLKTKFGVLWDKNKQPYCPIHEKPLSRHKVRSHGKIVTGLGCPECSKHFHLMTDEGKRLTLEDAKKKL